MPISTFCDFLFQNFKDIRYGATSNILNFINLNEIGFSELVITLINGGLPLNQRKFREELFLFLFHD